MIDISIYLSSLYPILEAACAQVSASKWNYEILLIYTLELIFYRDFTLIFSIVGIILDVKNGK